MSIAFLSLGSNLGDRLENLGIAVDLISKHPEIEVLKLSNWLENPPIEGAGDNDFLNGVIKVETSLEPKVLLDYILEIEQKIGRAPCERKMERKQARKIDIDILIFDDLFIEEEDLKIPHPRMQDRFFVMEPLFEIEPSFKFPKAYDGILTN